MVNKITTPPTNNEVIDKVNEIIDNLGGFPYGESDSAADAVQKEVTISEITTLKAGQIIIVKPTITSTVADATLKLNNFTAYPMLYGAAAITTSTDSITWAANYPSWFRFDGSNWVFLGHGVDNNTTYSAMTTANGIAGTETTARLMRADRLKPIIQGTTLTGLSTSTNSAVTASDTVTTGIGKLQAQVNAKQATITSSNKLSASLVSGLATVATSGSYNDLSNKPTIPVVTDTYTATGTDAVNGKAVSNAIAVKQDTLVSGTNIKTINGNSLLGSGNITIETSSTPNVDGQTISYNTNDALQTIGVINKRNNAVIPLWQGSENQWNNGVPKTWYYWQTSVTALWTSGGNLPSSANWVSVTYGDGKFVAVTYGSDKSAYSTDGINWTASTLPSSANLISVTYGDGKFVAIATGSDKSAYSTDGVNWTASTLPSSANWRSVTYGDGKFVAVTYGSSKAAYSTDGVNWTASTLPSSANWQSVTYGDGKFVAVAYNSSKAAYSTDGVNWTASTLPSSVNWQSVTYGDGKFVAVSYGSDVTAIFTIQYDKCYTDAATPTTSSTVYSAPETTSALTVSSVTSGAITLSNNNTYYYNQSGNQYTYQTIGDAHPEYLCFIDGKGVKMGNNWIATNNSNNS